MVSHSRAAAPNEACGLIAFADNLAQKVYPTDNVDASPHSFTVDPEEQYRAVVDAEEMGWEIGGSFHSHPEGDHNPSPTDIARSPGVEWLHVIVGLGSAEPTLGVYRIGARVVPCLYTISD